MQGKPVKVIETLIGRICVYESREAKDIENLYELMIRLLMEEIKEKSSDGNSHEV